VDPFDPEKWPRFVRFPSFTCDWERFGLDDADLRSLELEIIRNPTRWPVIQGTAGLRKIRFSGPRAARGKSGAYRVCYVFLPEFGTIALVVIFGKSEKDNLNHADRCAISSVVEAYRDELETKFG
jgi:mRNA-degrading endonuclease RelE of RelBE toxin-antitoxin system